MERSVAPDTARWGSVGLQSTLHTCTRYLNCTIRAVPEHKAPWMYILGQHQPSYSFCTPPLLLGPDSALLMLLLGLSW